MFKDNLPVVIFVICIFIISLLLFSAPIIFICISFIPALIILLLDKDALGYYGCITIVCFNGAAVMSNINEFIHAHDKIYNIDFYFNTQYCIFVISITIIAWILHYKAIIIIAWINKFFVQKKIKNAKSTNEKLDAQWYNLDN